MSYEFQGWDIGCDSEINCRGHLYNFGDPGDDEDDIASELERLGWSSDDEFEDNTVCPSCTATDGERKAAAERLAQSGVLISADGSIIDTPLFDPAEVGEL